MTTVPVYDHTLTLDENLRAHGIILQRSHERSEGVAYALEEMGTFKHPHPLGRKILDWWMATSGEDLVWFGRGAAGKARNSAMRMLIEWSTPAAAGGS